MTYAAGHSDRDRVLEATDLVHLVGEHVSLKPKGREHVGLCPFHDDSAPSLHIVTHKGTPFYKCFACGEAGNAIDFVITYHKMPFIEALRFLADRNGIELASPEKRRDASRSTGEPSRGDLIEANEFGHGYFKRVLLHAEAGRQAREAIESRGISDEMIEQFGLGAAPARWDGLIEHARRQQQSLRALRGAGLVRDGRGGELRDTFVNRLIFPICDQLGRPIAFGGRVLNNDDKPKYLNSPESDIFKKAQTLYGLHLARKAIDDANIAIITEGYTDVIAMHQHGLRNVVATLGTALTRSHARILQRLCDTVILLFDGDHAGIRAADRAVEIFFVESIDVKICILPDECDPDDMLRSHPEGRAKLESMFAGAEDAMSFLFRQFNNDYRDEASISGRQKRAESFLARLADLGFHEMPGIRKRLVTPMLAQLLGMGIDVVERAMPARSKRTAPERISEPKSDVIDGEASAPVEEAAVTDGESPFVPRDSVPRRRRIAEQDLLAMLVFEPSTTREHVDTGEGHMLPLAEAYLPESFADPTYRIVYEAMHAHMESQTMFTVSSLCDTLDDDTLKKAVTDLYFRGETLCGGDETNAPRRLAMAARAFDKVRDTEQLHEHRRSLERPQKVPSEGLSNLQTLIEARRAIGDDRTAFPRSIRGA